MPASAAKDLAAATDLRTGTGSAANQLSTAAKHGHNMIDVLREAILGRPWTPLNPVPT